MASKVSTTETGSVMATIQGEKGKNMKDYLLQSLEFEAAQNGVVANLRYRLKPSVEAKLAKKTKGNYVDYDAKYCNEKLVFEGFDADEVSDLLVDAMKQIKASKKGAE